MLDNILWFGFTFDLDLIMSTILHPYYTPDIILTYSESVAISTQFTAFNHLVDSSAGLVYTRQASLPKTLHQ